MMQEVAKRYALSLFEVACESGQEKELLESLGALSGLFMENREIVQLLSAPILTREQKFEVVEQLCSQEQNLYLHNFLKILCEKNRIDSIFEISAAYEAAYNDKHNIQKVVAITAIALKASLLEALKAKLEGMLQKTVFIENQVDPSILGGVLLKIDNTQIDSTIRTRIEGLRNQIASSIA